MANITIIAKNQTLSPLPLYTLAIPDNSLPASPAQVTLTDFAEPEEIYNSDELLSYIQSGDVILNDGSSDLTMTQSEEFITQSNLYSDITNAGVTGLQGGTGIFGQTGLQGITGIQSVTGIQGLTGFYGQTGIRGQTGIQGIQGATGISGDQSRVCDLYSTINSGNLATSPTTTDLTFNAQREIDTSHFSHTPGTAEVTINVTGRYFIIARCNTDQTATNNRTESAIAIHRDTGSGFAIIPGTISYMYNRNNTQGASGTSSSLIIDLDAGDEIKMVAAVTSGGGTIFAIADGFSLTLQYIDTDILGTTGLQGITGLASGPQGATGIRGITGISPTINTLAVVQARRTTALTGVPLTWTDLTFDTTDVETDDTVIEHDNTLRDRIVVKRAGLYKITYLLVCDDEIQGRVRINDTTVIPGSTQQSGDPADTNDVLAALTTPVYRTLAVNDFLTVQTQAATTAENLQANALFLVELMQGPSGAQGATGLSPGPQGVTGLRGTTGIQGVTGIANTDLIDNIVNATGSTTTTSTTDILIPGMSITPAAGTYMVWFSSSGIPPSSETQTISIYAGGSQVTGSERFMVQTFFSTFNFPVASHARVTVNGAQAIQARWRVTAGTGELFARTLSIIQVSP